MAQHTYYWSCSPFADWLRGTAKPRAATMEEWNKWDDEAKAAHSFRYWFAEEGLGKLQDFVTLPVRKIYDLKYYINNRWVTRTHSLTAHPQDIKPGSWRDVGDRFLPCLFNELVDFVEIEQAWSHIAWGNEEDRAKYDPPFWASGWFRWRVWRSPQAGLDHLEWASKLTSNEFLEEGHPNWNKPTGQALDAIEILALYKWWKARPARPDPYEASGWSEVCNIERKKLGGRSGFGFSAEQKKASNKALKLLGKIEAQYEKEDNEMLIRLIKIRKSLWT